MTTPRTTESLTELTRKGICIEFFSAYQDLDIQRMLSSCDPNGEIHFQPLGKAGRGRIGELGRNLWAALMDCFPDLDNTVDSATAQDDSIVCRVTIFGTQQKDFAGISTKGLRFDSDHIFIFRFNKEDRIDNINISWDHDSFQKQLGA